MTDLIESKPIFSFVRRSITEVVVHGVTAIKHQGKPLTSPEGQMNLVTRSLLKPWQALATGGFDATQSFWALCIASHSGQPHQLELLNRFVQESGGVETELVCPRALPMDVAAASALKASGQQASRLHHPCAGKHLLMTAVARREGLPVDQYWHEDHPIQKRIQLLVGREASEKLAWVTDSCGLPVAVMSVRALMNMYEKFALDQGEAAQGLRSLWLQNPRLVGGYRRLDSDIMEACSGKILAKEGADGLLMVQSLPLNDEPACGCFIKISSGYSVPHLGLGLWSLLSSQETLTPTWIQLKDYLRSRLEEWVPKDQNLQILLGIGG